MTEKTTTRFLIKRVEKPGLRFFLLDAIRFTIVTDDFKGNKEENKTGEWIIRDISGSSKVR